MGIAPRRRYLELNFDLERDELGWVAYHDEIIAIGETMEEMIDHIKEIIDHHIFAAQLRAAEEDE